jgi:hypothetical protein
MTMKKENLFGGILSIIAALMGIIGHMLLFQKWYQIGMHTSSAEPGCEILLKYLHPLMADLGILGGVLFAVSAYGYFTKKNWAFFLSVIALVLALLGSWFINVPYMAADLPPIYFPLFWPYVLFYILFLRVLGKISWSQTFLALFTGIAYIFCWMNGVASTSRIITIGTPIFVLVQRLHWVAMLGWAVVTVGIIMRPKEWMRVVGLVAGGHPISYCYSSTIRSFLALCLGTDILPDFGHPICMAWTVAAANRCNRMRQPVAIHIREDVQVKNRLRKGDKYHNPDSK